MHVHRVLHKALADAESCNLVDRNVASRATVRARIPPEVLHAGHVARMRNATRDHLFGHLLFAVNTGARQR